MSIRLVAAFVTGAVAGALVLPRLRRSRDRSDDDVVDLRDPPVRRPPEDEQPPHGRTWL